jgi:anti-anti-sigma factor
MIEIVSASVGRVTLIEVKGRVDSINAPELDAALQQEISNGHKQVILDLAGVEYMSAAGLRVLRHIYTTLGNVRISRPSERIREVLQITGLDTTYQIHENQVDAIHALTPVTNAHTHLELGWLANYCPSVGGAPFMEWIVGLIDRRRALGDKLTLTSTKAIEAGIQSLLDAGTTVVGDISGTGLSIAPLLESGLKGVVYLEVIGSNLDFANKTLVWARTIIDKWRSKERNGMKLGITIHTPYSVHPEVWTKALDYVCKEALPLCIHVAESKAERDYLLTGESPEMDIYYRYPGLERVPSPKKTPVQYLDDLGALELKPLLIHAIEVDDEDIQRIKRSGSAVVHCPRSNLRLRCNRMPLEKFIEAGVPVYFGTDSLSSTPSLNVLDELEVAAALHHGKVKPQTLEGLVHQTLPI